MIPSNPWAILVVLLGSLYASGCALEASQDGARVYWALERGVPVYSTQTTLESQETNRVMFFFPDEGHLICTKYRAREPCINEEVCHLQSVTFWYRRLMMQNKFFNSVDAQDSLGLLSCSIVCVLCGLPRNELTESIK